MIRELTDSREGSPEWQDAQVCREVEPLEESDSDKSEGGTVITHEIYDNMQFEKK